jgi:hypothetical protein
MAYCKEQDLLIGDVTLSPVLSRLSYIRDAADEMDARIGFVYLLPLPLTLLQPHAITMLKMINARLASGRLLMSIAAPAEDDGVHRYGEWLIKSAYEDLYNICNRSIDLVGATPVSDPSPNVAAIYNYDEESAVDAFSSFVMRGELGTWWQPGSVP